MKPNSPRVLAGMFAACVLAGSPGLASSPVIYNRGETQIPSARSGALYLTSGSSSKCLVWFTEQDANKIGCAIDPSQIKEFELPSANSQPLGIAADERGTPWVAEWATRRIATVTDEGSTKEYGVDPSFGRPFVIVAGPRCSFWYTGNPASQLGWTTEEHKAQAVSFGYHPWSIAARTDMPYIWFIERDGSLIGRVDYKFRVTSYDVLPSAGPAAPEDYPGPAILVAPDETVWFTELFAPQVGGAAIGRLTPDGKVKFFRTPTSDSEPSGLFWDGSRIWFSEYRASKIGMIDSTGIVTEYPTQTPGAGPIGITEDDFGTLFFVERKANKLGWFQLRPGTVTSSSR